MEQRADSNRSQSAIGKFGGEQFEDEALREPFEINLGSFAFLGRVMIHSAEQRAHRIPAGTFHRRMDGARGVFRGKSASHFHGRSETADEAEGFGDFLDLRSANRSVTDFVGSVAPISDKSGDETGEDRVDFAFG